MDFGNDDIYLDRAASAFPDIGVDGLNDVPLPTAQPSSNAQPAEFSFDALEDPLQQPAREVKVTGDDEIEKFEDQFPDISGSVVRGDVCRKVLGLLTHSH